MKIAYFVFIGMIVCMVLFLPAMCTVGVIQSL